VISKNLVSVYLFLSLVVLLVLSYVLHINFHPS